jgi:hypothetical protein
MIESEAIDVRAGDVHITPEQIGDVNIGTYGPDDYVLSTGNKVKAELITNNTVRLFDGVMVYGGIRDAVPVNKYYDITIDNGSQGKNRNDIIVRRYTKDDDSQKKARAVFTIVKGTPSDGIAVDPTIEMTDIRAGALTHDFPLHRVRLEGLNIVAVEPLFDVLMPMSEQQDMLTELNRKRCDKLVKHNNTSYQKTQIENFNEYDFFVLQSTTSAGARSLSTTMIFKEQIKFGSSYTHDAIYAPEASIYQSTCYFESDGSVYTKSKSQYDTVILYGVKV